MAESPSGWADVARGADPEPGQRIGAYEVLRTLARGGMATVYAARDTRNGREVAIKLLHSLQLHDDDVRARFRREFQALSRLDHPNVLAVYESGLHADRPWFSMELLRGRTLAEEAEALRALPPEARFARITSILRQVARALAYVHDRGLVHRDVTPGNVIVDDAGHAKLMDFGVVKEQGTDHTAVGELIGTAAYMAPEQIEGRELDARTDLYSLGAVLYLLLTGRKPFAAHTLHGFMDKHLREAPRPPRELDPDIPETLDAVCLRLLQKDPNRRYASASHLLHALGERDEHDVEGARWPPRTIGRIPIRARLHQALDRVQKGQGGGAYVLLGPLGFGKTRLLQLTETWAEGRGLPFAAGRCRDDDRPFGAFSGVYAALADPGESGLLAEVFGGTLDGAFERYPIIKAFRELVERSAPCVIALDDVHHIDPASLELLTYLVRNLLEREGASVLFALAVEGPATRVRGHLGEIQVVQELAVGPLGEAEVEELVLSVVRPGEAATALARRLHVESGGSPAFIVDMLNGLLDDGRIVEGEAGLELAVDAAEITRSKLPMPASLRQALKERLEPLSADALAVGRTLAVSRRRVPLDVLADAAPVGDERALLALDELVDARICEERTEGEVDYVGLAHGRYRDVLLEGMDPDALALAHRRMGEALERHHRRAPGPVLAELAWHFERAGVATKACAYLLRTAQQHLHRSGYEECLAYTDRALAMEPAARPWLVLDDADHQLAEIHLARAQARFNLGQPQRALESTREADRLARRTRDPRLASRVQYHMGIQLRHTGHNEEAAPYLERAMEQAQLAGDQGLVAGPLYELGGVAWARGDLARAERCWKESLDIATRIGDKRAQGHGYNGLGILAICRGQAMEARRHMEQSARIFAELGMLGPLVIAKTNLVELCLNTGSIKKALQLAEQAVERTSEAHQLQGLALSMAWRAQVLLTLHQLDPAMDDVVESLRLCRQLGAREDEVIALAVRTRIALARGDHKEALFSVQELQPLLTQHDHEGIAPQVSAWHARALAGLGRRPAATAVLQNARAVEDAWPHVRIRGHISVGRALRMLDRDAEAREHFASALAGAESAGFRYFQLLAHHELVQVEPDEAARARHDRVARALARSLAANLSREHAASFLSRGWGLADT